jgi:DNA helicase HerA-like ATPase
VRNRLSNISTRCAGLVTDDGIVSDLPFGSFEDRAVYVVDVANLEEDAQDLIFARVVSKLREHLERRDLGVKHLVVFVDELNKYAASDAQDTYVRRMLLDIAERGRYLGLVLFGAQQFRSQVHRRLSGNSGTSIFGRMDPDELASPVYSTLSPAVKTKLSSLEKGQLMVRHPHFTQPIFVRFPRPAVLSGRDGMERFPQSAEVPLEISVWRALQSIDPSVTYEWVARTTSLYDEEEIVRARNRTMLARPADVKTFFSRALPSVVAPQRSEPKQFARPLLRVPEGEDPYSA